MINIVTNLRSALTTSLPEKVLLKELPQAL